MISTCVLLLCIIQTEQKHTDEAQNYTNSNNFHNERKLPQNNKQSSSSLSFVRECVSAYQLYKGVVSIDGQGQTCVHWSESNINEDMNYCRNVYGEQRGPWCFIKDNYDNIFKSYCKVPYCSECYLPFHQSIRTECKSTQAGLDYRGTTSKATDGFECLPWLCSSNITEESNYCRNIDRDKKGPWCYIDIYGIEKRYCNIPYCSDCYIPAFNLSTRKECKLTRAGLDYNGTMSHAYDGSECLPWLCSSNINEESNYCRNADGDERGPWCYVDVEYGYKDRRLCDIPYCSWQDIDHKECKSTRRGIEYAGTMSKTADGQECQLWSVHTTIHFEFPENNVTLSKNYCRNVKLDSVGDMISPWCYTEDWGSPQFCDIPYCVNVTINKQECKSTSDGFEYAGTVSQTIEGYQCLKWSNLSTYSEVMHNYQFPENNVTTADNYCRYIYNSATNVPWCFTKDPNIIWQRCDIPMCTESAPNTNIGCKNDRQGFDYKGRVSHAIDGSLCMLWETTSCVKQLNMEIESNDYDMHAIYKRSNGQFTFINETLEEVQNFCRNPDNSKDGPWCFNKECSVKRCGIPICSISGEINDKYINGPDAKIITRHGLLQIADEMCMYGLPIIVGFGIVTNILSVSLFKRPKFKKLTTSILFTVLACTDTASLCVGALVMFLQKTINYYMTDVNCQIYSYVKYVTLATSGWILVFISLDRVLKITTPHKAESICKMKNICICCVIAVLLICLSYIPVPMSICSHDLIIFNDNVNFKVETYCAFPKHTGEYFRMIHMLIHSYIPFTIMLVGTIVIIVYLYKTIRKRSSLKSTDKSNSEMGKVITVSISLIAVNTSYLLLTLPYIFYTILIEYIREMYSSNDEFHNAQYLLYVCSMTCEYINNSINFILYCTAGKPYRDEFKSMMGWARCSKHTSNVSPTSNTQSSALTTQHTQQPEMHQHPGSSGVQSDVLLSLDKENTLVKYSSKTESTKIDI